MWITILQQKVINSFKTSFPTNPQPVGKALWKSVNYVHKSYSY